MNRCYLYKGKEESLNHILLYYAKTRVLCKLVFSFFGVVWAMSSSNGYTLLSWHGYLLGK